MQKLNPKKGMKIIDKITKLLYEEKVEDIEAYAIFEAMQKSLQITMMIKGTDIFKKGEQNGESTSIEE